MGEGERKGRERLWKKVISICYVHTPTYHKECKRYALHTFTNEILKKTIKDTRNTCS